MRRNDGDVRAKASVRVPPSRPSKHTMHDVAQLADVAVSTVSALINGAPNAQKSQAVNFTLGYLSALRRAGFAIKVDTPAHC